MIGLQPSQNFRSVQSTCIGNKTGIERIKLVSACEQSSGVSYFRLHFSAHSLKWCHVAVSLCSLQNRRLADCHSVPVEAVFKEKISRCLTDGNRWSPKLCERLQPKQQ